MNWTTKEDPDRPAIMESTWTSRYSIINFILSSFNFEGKKKEKKVRSEN